jgi:hypothetical protein
MHFFALGLNHFSTVKCIFVFRTLKEESFPPGDEAHEGKVVLIRLRVERMQVRQRDVL